jgi:hypothetical protein
MCFTFVTALYEIQREKNDNRNFSMYQEWFSKTLTVPVPMVIFTEEKNRHIVEGVRKGLPTKVICTSLHDVPFYYTVDDVKRIINHTPFKYRIVHPNALENTCYEYIPLIQSKFKWVMHAIEHNYFQTELFFWIDAGLSRFMTFDMSSVVFNRMLIDEIDKNKMLYFQIGRQRELYDILNNPEKIHGYVGSNTNFIMAGFFGGDKSLLYDVCKESSELYIAEFIKNEQVDGEQTLLGYVLPKYKNKLYLVNNHPSQTCINYCMFCSVDIE